jgi:hypothetical protein
MAAPLVRIDPGPIVALGPAASHDHVIIRSEAHLGHVLRAYLAYYNTARPHQSLDNNSPQPRVIEASPRGRIIAIPQVGGLHHRYTRVA